MKPGEQSGVWRPYHGAVSSVKKIVRVAAIVTLILGWGWLGSCSGDPQGLVAPPPPPPPEGLIVSNPVSAVGLATGTAPTAGPSIGVADEVTYVSLAPGTIPTGSTASIQRVGDAGTIITAISDGGFDPVPVHAQAGDSIDVVVKDAGGAIDSVLGLVVAARRPPIVVRTNPPRKKRDVPLNSAIVVVFSEPVNGGTLTSSSVQLFRGTTSIPGTVRLLQGTATAAVFEPTAQLAANTEYRLVVTQAVRDLDDNALEADVTVEFTTGASSLGAVSSVTVLPDSANVSLGSSAQLTAVARDGSGTRISGRPVTWASDNPAVATVSATGLVTTISEGVAHIRAEVDGKVGVASIVIFALRVTTVTTGADLDADGYSVMIWQGGPMGGGLGLGEVGLPTHGTVTLSQLQPGSYNFEIRGLAANCEATSATRQFVSFNTSTTVVFEILCTTARQLAFASTEDGDSEIYVINSNGTGRTRLTTNPARDWEPAWSPDGAKIAFVSDRDGNAEIYVMDADGSAPVRLTSDPGYDGRPTWSPDGARIAFRSDRDGNLEIYAMNADGTDVVNLTNHAADDRDPAWSPDGAKIAFASDREGSNGAIDIFVMNADGSDLIQLTSYPAAEPAWSPDGARLTFTRFDGTDAHASVWVMNADGSDPHQLTVGACQCEIAAKPAWSPDGRWIIAFAATTEPPGSGPFGFEDEPSVLFVRAPAISHGQPEFLTAGFDPSWRPLPLVHSQGRKRP